MKNLLFFLLFLIQCDCMLASGGAYQISQTSEYGLQHRIIRIAAGIFPEKAPILISEGLCIIKLSFYGPQITLKPEDSKTFIEGNPVTLETGQSVQFVSESAAKAEIIVYDKDRLLSSIVSLAGVASPTQKSQKGAEQGAAANP